MKNKFCGSTNRAVNKNNNIDFLYFHLKLVLQNNLRTKTPSLQKVKITFFVMKKDNNSWCILFNGTKRVETRLRRLVPLENYAKNLQFIELT